MTRNEKLCFLLLKGWELYAHDLSPELLKRSAADLRRRILCGEAKYKNIDPFDIDSGLLVINISFQFTDKYFSLNRAIEYELKNT